MLRETQYVLSSYLTYKSIFLTDNQGRYPLLDKILIEQSFDIKRLFIVNENEAMELVKKLIIQKIFPKQDVPLTNITK
ncbi:MAG: hypothetical protein GY756_04095 [bacterium]|nr:hypothetical protein [bacterium]